MTTKKPPKFKAVDHCPHAKHCVHNAKSTIGPNGRCPDCGHQIFLPAPMFISSAGRHRMSGRSGRIRAIRMYEGSVMD